MASKPRSDNQNIQVFVRVRPSNSTEVKSRRSVEVTSSKEVSVCDSKQGTSRKTFSFNQVFGPKSSQIDVYRAVVQPLIHEVLSGYNCTVFAYGQTGTGKTFTMEGERSSNVNVSWENDPLAGIIPRTLSQLFDELRLLQLDFCVKVSFLELYNEELFDLLSPSEDTTKLRIFEDTTRKGSVIVSGLEEVSVVNKADVYQILEKGSHKRQTAATLLNAHSSRSHTVFTVTVHVKEPSSEGDVVMRTGKINLVDLAGSESIGRSGAVDKRAREAGNINQSLLTLGRVISALVDRSPHVPYRESKLTRILQESLGGCTKTSIIATVSPALCNLEETLSTLDYAHRAKNIQNKPQINQRICKKTILKEYSAEIERLQRDLEATRQRTGVYLDQGEYDDMILKLEQLDAERLNKEQHIIALAEEMGRKQAACDEVSQQYEELSQTLKERTAVLDSQKSKMVSLKSETSQVLTDISEKDHLMLCHLETERRLAVQADTLRKKALHSVSDLELLHEKIDRTRSANQKNEEAIQKFDEESTKIIDDVEELISQSVESMCNAMSNLSAATYERVVGIEAHIRDANDVAETLAESSPKTLKLARSIDSLGIFEAEMHDRVEELGEDFIKSSSECKVEYKSQIVDAVQSRDQWFAKLTDAVGGTCDKVCAGSEALLEVANESTTNILTKADNFVALFTENLGTSMETVESSVIKANAFQEEFLQIQEECDDKYNAILELLHDLTLLKKKSAKLTESHFEAFAGDISSSVSQLEDSMTSMKSHVKDNISEINSTRYKLLEQVDQFSSHVTCTIGEFDFNQELLPLEVLSEQGEKYRDAWEKVESNVNEELTKNVEHMKLVSASINSLAEEIQVDIAIHGQHIQEHLDTNMSIIEDLKSTVSNGKESLADTIETFRSTMKQQMEDFKTATDHVVAFGAKPCTPTGKTPQRSELRIPRDLAMTSPHERILNRLRNKFSSLSNASSGESGDSAFSESESDLSVSENDAQVNKEKENSAIVENKSAQKCFHSMLPKLRKPLSESN